MKGTWHLTDAQSAHQRLQKVWAEAKPCLLAGDRLEIEVRPERRNTAQNALLHAILGDIAERVEWAGKLRTVDVWKRLLVASWLRAEGESIEVLPALDGHGIDLVYAPTHQMSKAQMASLLDYIGAWQAERPEFAEMSHAE